MGGVGATNTAQPFINYEIEQSSPNQHVRPSAQEGGVQQQEQNYANITEENRINKTELNNTVAFNEEVNTKNLV